MYHLSKTPHAYYLYDTNSNKIFQINERVYDALCTPEGDSRKALHVLKQSFPKREYKEILKHGILQDTELQEYAIPISEEELKEKIESNLQHLVLEITQDCNFRCTYCVYSGEYRYSRTHAPLSMRWETALKAVDYFLKRTSQTELVTISFYGGEPLLEFDIIEKVVDHTKNKYGNQTVRFNINTNGYLLDSDKQNFFAVNNFFVRISLDGPRQVHDKYRVTKSGHSSFDVVIKNIENFWRHNKVYCLSNVSISSTILEPDELEEGLVFFENHPILKELRKASSLANPFGKWTDSLSYNNCRRFSNIFSANRELLKKRVINDHLPEAHPLQFFYLQYLRKIHGREISPLKRTEYPNNCCLPGIHKIYCKYDGSFSFCSREAMGLNIGSVDAGLSSGAIMRLIQDYCQLSINMCRECWAQRFCPACYTYAVHGSAFSIERKRQTCAAIKETLSDVFEMYCQIMECKPEALNAL
ncbi:4Fe-4S cluster-binding domain-containing protein [Dehalococcoidia bacterium]|nr:4Fe-4S cluster-binding domain-containing protein [Dehalococcoidia bacterium]